MDKTIGTQFGKVSKEEEKRLREDHYRMTIVMALMAHDEDDMIPALDAIKHHPTAEQLEYYDALMKRLESWRNLASFYRRQALYEYVMEQGHGSLTSGGKILGIGRAGAHAMKQSAEVERLNLVKAEDFVS